MVEQDELDQVKAQISAAIWYKDFLFIKNKLGQLTKSILTPGTHIQIKVQVDFNERYGLKLVIQDIDPSYTMGRLEMSRQKIIERLKVEGALDLNAKNEIPSVIQRVAVISSDTAAGYKDFITQCEENPYGYSFRFELFKAAMQGQNTEREICAALDQIIEIKDEYDVVVIIRGGGSKLDLSAFDNFNIAMKISKTPLPVITGIGHEIDQSVTDLVSALSLKTPTAVADFIIERSLHFESRIIDISKSIMDSVRAKLSYADLVLNQINQSIFLLPKSKLEKEMINIDNIGKNININSSKLIERHKFILDTWSKNIEAYDPKNVLEKGFTLVKQNSKYIGKLEDLKETEMTIEFSDGEIKVKSK